jgi:hypothetical protein
MVVKCISTKKSKYSTTKSGYPMLEARFISNLIPKLDKKS